MEVATRRFVRPEHMNHHQSLYAGYISEWITEASFIAVAETLGRTDHVVLAGIKEIRMIKPVQSGTVLELQYEVKKYGTTSIEYYVEGTDFLTHDRHFRGSVVFVTVDDKGRKKPHGKGGRDGNQGNTAKSGEDL